ncbi:AI-2E family transporter [Aureimonas sp. SA4125]|uniref:AI-2E family transporter n=1 Tax=Aureimonas sp. SA4125 TaxID=2826993 RepID=UPI001CC82449|nr:AI-2E family transporter [Aureimonas sp. SA4125]BDA84932.1 AI-2E family transporter [Aureimonas sp. SA4125]
MSTAPGGPRWAIVGIFLILLFGALYLTSSFVLPVIIALLFALVLSPIVRLMRRRLRIPEPVSAITLVVGALVTLFFGFYMLSNPITELVNNAPKYVAAVEEQLKAVRDRLDRLQELPAPPAAAPSQPASPVADEPPQEVVVKSPGLLDDAAQVVPQILASILFSMVFLYFLLASGDLFYVKLVKAMPTLSDKKLALRIAHDIERELSHYLLTITMINVGLGTVVGFLLWLVGMPTPLIFGALAALLNFIPYLGALTGMGLVGVIALAEFGDLWQALVPVALYFVASTIEGQFIQPTVVGRRLEMNAVAIFLSVAFWGWIWGVVGMFVAVPMMVGLKIFASYIEPLHPLADFLSAQKDDLEEPEPAVKDRAA